MTALDPQLAGAGNEFAEPRHQQSAGKYPGQHDRTGRRHSPLEADRLRTGPPEGVNAVDGL